MVPAYLQSTGELLRSLSGNRRLLVALMKREISDEYVTHNLSIGWNFIHPLFLMVVYLFIFTDIFPTRVRPQEIGSDAIIYLLSGIIPWLALQQVMGRSTMSVVSNSSIVKQISFPLELLPVKTLAGPAVYTAVSLVFLVGYAIWKTDGALIPSYLVGLPPLILITFIQLVGIALLLSSIQVFFPDTKEFINLFLTIGLFIQPILYLPNAIPAIVRPIIYASPFSYLIFCWHDVLFFGRITSVLTWAILVSLTIAFFVLGARLFIVTKHHFGDFV